MYLVIDSYEDLLVKNWSMKVIYFLPCHYFDTERTTEQRVNYYNKIRKKIAACPIYSHEVHESFMI